MTEINNSIMKNGFKKAFSLAVFFVAMNTCIRLLDFFSSFQCSTINQTSRFNGCRNPLPLMSLLESFMRLNEREPPVYNSHKRSPKLYKSKLHHYIGKIPGAFRPPVIPTGLGQRDCTLYGKYNNVANALLNRAL